ncbi:hypothetical protein [Capnocytophaga sputigena]|uniref:hypothetical protein n=1 Tax=Capnocytophaga sputigena TaxID=1019 RepID=UPI00241C90AC
MKRLILYIIVSFLLVNCKAPSYLPKEHKIGEVEYFDFDDFDVLSIRNDRKTSGCGAYDCYSIIIFIDRYP